MLPPRDGFDLYKLSGGGGGLPLHPSSSTVKTRILGRELEAYSMVLEVDIFLGFGTPFYPLDANFFEPNPVWNKYSIKTGFIEYSIKKVARTGKAVGVRDRVRRDIPVMSW
jgi:hypothetical protein